jgi:hypothetical protein
VFLVSGVEFEKFGVGNPTKGKDVRNALDGSKFLCRYYLTVYPNASIISSALSSVRAGLFFIMFWIKSQ